MNEYAIRVASKTEKARRSANEDSLLVLNGQELTGLADGLYVVADGMGGRASGAVASRITVDAVRDAFVAEMDAASDPSDVLAGALRAANQAVCNESASKTEMRGMGSTCVAVAVRDGRAFFAHMGDSRIYLLHGGRIRRLTEDHSFVAEKVRAGEITEDEARHSRFRNVITRAIGIEPNAQPAVGSIELESGDVILLCSDGLTGPVSDARIADILCSSPNPEEACNRLVSAAIRGGGSDNITVVVAAYGAHSAARREPTSAGRGARSSWIPFAAIALAVGIALGFCLGRFLPRGTGAAGVREKSPPAKTELARAGYADPVPLTYLPLQPGFLALDPQGFVHVVDLQGRRMKLDASGRVTATYPARDTFKPRGSAPVQSASADSHGNLYVSDPVGKKILRFGSNGLLLGMIGEGKLASPSALAIGGNGDIFVIDGGRLKVIRARFPENTETTDGKG